MADTRGLACETCPIAVWFVASMAQCHCPALMMLSWSPPQSTGITLCDARERAIELAMQADLAAVESR